VAVLCVRALCDFVDVVKQPSGKMGLGGALKEKVKSFISSEG
jgi:hypothetical protein